MKHKKTIVLILFIVYGLCMLWLLFGQRLDRTFEGTYIQQLRSNPIPFETIRRFGNIILSGDPAYLIPHAWQNLVGNIVMFIPLGASLPFFFKKCRSAKRTFLIGLLIIACVELTQFFTLLGSLDFDDFMLNSIGIMLGYSGWNLLPAEIRD